MAFRDERKMQGVMLRLRGGFYKSYKTHNYCKRCDLWQPKIGNYCTSCNYKTRKSPRFKTKKFRKTQWDKAY